MTVPSQRTSEAVRPHVRLRGVEVADLPALYQIQAEPEGSRMAAVIPRTEGAFQAHWAKVLSDANVVPRVILADGVLAGSISCFQRNGLNFVGYWLAREHWGKGIASRALALLLDEVSIRPLHARAARTNVASIRVLERCGFVATGYHHSPADERFLECEEAAFILK